MLTAVLLLLHTVQAVPAATRCDALAKLTLPSVSITHAESVTSGSFQPPGGQPVRNLPAVCRVAGSIRPSTDSDIQFEVWMPESGWNGKFQGIGNGGFAGSIGYGALGGAVSKGYAAAATDTGHRAGGQEAGWALGHPEKIIDFGYRAIHEAAVQGKAIVRAFYGENPKRSYFSSCSNGGRQALMEAQRFPGDYDGIIAGAPANYFTHLVSSAAAAMKATLATPGAYIPAAKLKAIQSAALAACDASDRVTDGVIEEPGRCKPDLAALTCNGSESESCLTKPQVEALRQLYEGPRNAKGRIVFPGLSPGGEDDSAGWAPWITGKEPQKSAMYAYGTQFFQNMVFSNPNWDYRTFDLDRDMKIADAKLGPVLNATDPDLQRFRARGGKLILYHGWCDAAIPAKNTIDYYNTVLKKMGESKVREFVRLFMAPGVQHCAGGAGPNAFGQGGPSGGDPSRDMNAALEQWVEKGVAPERIVATKYKGANAASGVLRTRPLCAHPKVAKWKGGGSTDDESNFECAAEGK